MQASLTQQALKVLRELMKHDLAQDYFNEPVDPEALGIPQYRELIKNPMDLGTIHNKLVSDLYSDLLEVLDDIRLVWDNCRSFNCEDSDVYAAADELEDEFQQLWKESGLHKLAAQLEQHRRQLRAGHGRNAAGGAGVPADHHPLHRCLAALERLLQHPDAKYVSSTAEALRHGWKDLEAFSQQPVHLGPIVQQLRAGAQLGWQHQAYTCADQVVADVDTVWKNFTTYFSLHPPHPMNAKLERLRQCWREAWQEQQQQQQQAAAAAHAGMKRVADAAGDAAAAKQQRVQQPYAAQVQSEATSLLHQQRLQQRLQQQQHASRSPSSGGTARGSPGGAKVYKGSRCEVCLRNKKGKCGSRSASMKCLKRKENGLPYYSEQAGRVIRPLGYTSEDDAGTETTRDSVSRQTSTPARSAQQQQQQQQQVSPSTTSAAAAAAAPAGGDACSPAVASLVSEQVSELQSQYDQVQAELRQRQAALDRELDGKRQAAAELQQQLQQQQHGQLQDLMSEAQQAAQRYHDACSGRPPMQQQQQQQQQQRRCLDLSFGGADAFYGQQQQHHQLLPSSSSRHACNQLEPSCDQYLLQRPPALAGHMGAQLLGQPPPAAGGAAAAAAAAAAESGSLHSTPTSYRAAAAAAAGGFGGVVMAGGFGC